MPLSSIAISICTSCVCDVFRLYNMQLKTDYVCLRVKEKRQNSWNVLCKPKKKIINHHNMNFHLIGSIENMKN